MGPPTAGTIGPAERLRDNHGEAVVRTKAAVFFRNIDCQQTLLAELVPQFAGENFILFPLLVVGLHLRFDETAYIVAK